MHTSLRQIHTVCLEFIFFDTKKNDIYESIGIFTLPPLCLCLKEFWVLEGHRKGQLCLIGSSGVSYDSLETCIGTS